jgi:two-component system KDP operon response regulator KdpE
MARILVVDDAPEMTWLLDKALSKDHHEVEVAHDGLEGLRQAYAFRPDLIVLDIMMPEMDGWDMLRRLREFSDVPVIMLTALGETKNKVHGLDIGADDYMAKPFEMDELRARIRATLRRGAPAAHEDHTLRFDNGQLVIDPASRQVTVRGELVDLTPTEYRLLLYLSSHAGRTVSHAQILENVWGPGYEDSATNVKVYIRNLRNKIEVDSRNPRYILNQWGVGYYLAKR